jgi:hypothetical protein
MIGIGQRLFPLFRKREHAFRQIAPRREIAMHSMGLPGGLHIVVLLIATH